MKNGKNERNLFELQFTCRYFLMPAAGAKDNGSEPEFVIVFLCLTMVYILTGKYERISIDG